MILRPLDLDRDIVDYARLRSRSDDMLVTPDLIRERMAAYAERVQSDMVVADDNGTVAGFARWARFDYEAAGSANLTLAVAPEYEGRGIGSLLMHAIQDSFARYGITKPFSGAREGWTRSLAFARRHGFGEVRRYHELQADLTTLDPSIEESAASVCASHDLEVVEYAIDGPNHPALPQLYDCFAEADADEPSTQVLGVPSFEHFCGWWEMAENCRGMVIAAEHQGVVVGMTRSVITDAGEVWTEFTGTRRAWRGKGIAKALKATLLVREARRGSTSMMTSNSSENAAMLAINEKLGFKSRPAWIVLAPLETVR
jgi:mycothiol synthase